MSHVARALAIGTCAAAVMSAAPPAGATPFADVPANHWAYQAIASLAADGLIEGYSDGQFKGDRPLSRYEMAVLVARVLAKVQANGAGYASKVDLDKIQKLVDALKDELDSLGVRVANVEDAVDALDKRTKFAQSIQFHGDLYHNFSERQSVVYPHSVANQTGAPVGLYYGGNVPAGAAATVDPFVDAFLRTPEDNSPLDVAPLVNYIRFDDRIALTYTVNDNLTIAFPVHILNYDTGGAFTTGAQYSVQPDLVVDIAHSGSLSNLTFRFGELNNIDSSRLGLTYRAPSLLLDGSDFQYPIQNLQRGVQVGATVGGLTDVQVNFSRIDPALINTQLNVLDVSGQPGLNNYLSYVDRPPTTYVQPGAPGSTSGALRTDTFTAGTAPLAQVYLSEKAQLGTVFISQYDGSLFNASAIRTGGAPGGPAAPPGFLYNNAYNSVVFSGGLPVGSTVAITYVGLQASNEAAPQRYDFNLRVNTKLKALPGGEIGLTFNRIFDTDESATPEGIVNVGLPNASGNGLVSDSVLGLDTQIPLGFVHLGGDNGASPSIFGEIAQSRYSPDYRSIAAVDDGAAVVGLRLRIPGITASVSYQLVGTNFLDGAPLQYFGNPPTLFGYYNHNYFPAFDGFANNAAINARYDAANPACAANRANCTLSNPNLTFIYPVFNPFVATGSQFFSAYAPNTSGVTLNVNAPVRIGNVGFNTRLTAQHLSELAPDSSATQFYSSYSAAQFVPSNKRMTLDHVEAGAQFDVPVLKHRVGINLSGAFERLSRPDTTGTTYVPVDPATLTSAGPAVPSVTYYPNYTDMYHTTIAAAASVPLTKDVIFGASYNSQGFYGAYGTTIGQNISERKDTYVGSITYNIPRTTSSVAFALRNYKYSDLNLPSFNTSENKEDINFVIRF